MRAPLLAAALVAACADTSPPPPGQEATPARAPAAAHTVDVATLEWPPYTGEHLPEQGWVSQVVREAYAHEGYSVTFHWMPWSRALQETEAQLHDVVMPAYSTAERARTYEMSAPLPAGSIELWTRRALGLPDGAEMDALVAHPLGVVRGYANPPQIDGDPRWRSEEAADDLSNLRKLAYGRVDLVVVDDFTARWLVRTQLPDSADDLRPLLPALEQRAVHVAVPRSNPRQAELSAAFDRGLSALVAQGRLAAILQAWGLDAPAIAAPEPPTP